MNSDITDKIYFKIKSYFILHFFNFLAVKHVQIFIAAKVVAFHLIFILIFVMCLENGSGCIYYCNNKVNRGLNKRI